jgi:hypothetical protein
MAITSIIERLSDIYREHFNRGAGDLRIKRVTETVPEAATEWPWLYFVLDEGDVALKTFADDLPATPRRFRSITTFGSPDTERRPKLDVTHRFKAQLLVRPRRDLVEDEAKVRPFIEPLVKVAVENLDLGGLVQYCRPTGYRYGVLTLGRVEERATEYVGLEIMFEAQEIV